MVATAIDGAYLAEEVSIVVNPGAAEAQGTALDAIVMVDGIGEPSFSIGSRYLAIAAVNPVVAELLVLLGDSEASAGVTCTRRTRSFASPLVVGPRE